MQLHDSAISVPAFPTKIAIRRSCSRMVFGLLSSRDKVTQNTGRLNRYTLECKNLLRYKALDTRALTILPSGHA